MANSRKLWKTRKFAQLIFITTFSVMLILAIYSMKEKHPTKYVLKEQAEEYLEYHLSKTEKKSSLNLDSSNHIKIIGTSDGIDKVSFRAKTESVSVSAFPGLKLVHLDLKGAPPKSTYYADFFPFIKKLGASGVVLEYEDMFPYTSVDAAAHNAYTKEEINVILHLANESSLEVIPLVQTFGHLEFLLKLDKYKHLRENEKYPQAICPSKNESMHILFSVIDEILDAHKNIRYIHIGCDEVYQIGECNDCKEKLYQNKWNNRHLMLHHITTLAKYISKKTEGKVKPLVWDDELRLISLEELQEWRIGHLIEPVIWKYTTDVENYLVEDLWQKYSVIFKAVWFASAFKGARYPNAFTTYSNYYFENHKSWMNLIYKYSDKIFFRGGIITGWQRYDHFAVLCELLPVSIPSLALNLIYLSTDIKTLVELSVKTQRVCGCDANPVMATTPRGSCTFPGACLYISVTRIPQVIFAFQREKDRSHYKGWMSNYNIKFSFSNPSYLFINNEWVDALSGETFKTTNPTTGEVIAEVQKGGKADVDRAVAAAKEAFKLGSPWRKMDAAKRGILINKLADLMERDSVYLSSLEALECGKVYSATLKGDLPWAVRNLRYFAGYADKNNGITPSIDGNFITYTRHEPVGVCGLITAWNFSILMVSWKLSPALAAGCTMVLKPSQHTSLAALHVAELVKEAGFPPGVINFVPGFGDVGGAMVTHPDVDKISFTGSTEVGKQIYKNGAENMKRLTLELGGKSPNIILPDADIDKAVEHAHYAAFHNMGQCCCAGSRTFVHESIYEQFIEKTRARIKAKNVGDPFDLNVDHGPQATKEQMNTVMKMIESGKKEGATLELGGNAIDGPGFFVEPTLFTNVKDDMTIAKEEIFGPVQQVMTYKTIDEVIERANSSEYGLASSIFGQNLDQINTITQGLRAGSVWINCYFIITPQSPFGGYKMSGLGREGGPYGISAFTEVKSVFMKTPSKNS